MAPGNICEVNKVPVAMQLVISVLLHFSMECLTSLTIKYFLALLLHVHVKTGGFKEMWSARVLGNILLSTTA